MDNINQPLPSSKRVRKIMILASAAFWIFIGIMIATELHNDKTTQKGVIAEEKAEIENVMEVTPSEDADTSSVDIGHHNVSISNRRAAKTSDRSDDDEYWRSVERQRELERRGYDGAANMERRARQEYMRGGGYHAPDGSPQVQFQGSREQAEQLRQMDELGW